LNDFNSSVVFLPDSSYGTNLSADHTFRTVIHIYPRHRYLLIDIPLSSIHYTLFREEKKGNIRASSSIPAEKLIYFGPVNPFKGGFMAAVEVRDLKKSFKEIKALDGIDFDVPEGKIVSLLGPNGAGKSTTISVLCGLLPSDGGETYVLGKSVRTSPREVKGSLGVVPQEVALYPDLSAKENLLFWGRMYGLSGRTLKERTAEVLDLTGLAERQHKKIETFSGGMKRRINIGAALLHKPQVLIMDEPTVGIDPQSRRHILDSVKRLNENGMTVLYTTHYMEEAQELSHHIVIIDHGKVIASGTHAELIKLVGSLDRIRAVVAGNAETAVRTWSGLPGVKQVSNEENIVTILAEESDPLLPELFRTAHEGKIHVQSVDVKEPNLEAVFLHLTGRELRD
jgi:ABC-2 type transport system ATP-binding protein